MKKVRKFRTEDKQTKQGIRKANKRGRDDERKNARNLKKLKGYALMILMLITFTSNAQYTPVFQHASVQQCVSLPYLELIQDTFVVQAHHELVILDTPHHTDSIAVHSSHLNIMPDGSSTYKYVLANKYHTHIALTYVDNELLHVHLQTRWDEGLCFDSKAKAILYIEVKKEEY